MSVRPYKQWLIANFTLLDDINNIIIEYHLDLTLFDIHQAITKSIGYYTHLCDSRNTTNTDICSNIGRPSTLCCIFNGSAYTLSMIDSMINHRVRLGIGKHSGLWTIIIH